MGALLLTMLLGASVLVVARFSPRTRNDSPDEVVADQNPVSGAMETGAPGSGRFPYLTVAVVLFGTWAVLTLATTSPLILVAVLLVLVVSVYATYKIRHRSLENRELVGRSLSDLRLLAARVLNDFWTTFVRLRSWYRERRARMEREKAAQREKQAQERERLARERERLAQLERQRRARPYNDHLTIGEYEDIQRNLQREQQQHAEQMEQARIERERRKQLIEWMNRQNRH
jgi:hypothetical protein